MLAAREKESVLLIDEVEQFFHTLFGSHMNFAPKRDRNRRREFVGHDREREWIFLGGREGQMSSVATQQSLFLMVADPQRETTYFTNNGYYNNRQRLTESLRWLNSFVFDIDAAVILPDVLERLDRAGLPAPTAVIRTPRGGCHVHYFFASPVRATPKAIKLYTAIMRHIAEDIGSDPQAIGANRIFRTPTTETLIHFDQTLTYDFDLFKDWRDINHPYIPTKSERFTRAAGIMETPAIQKLLTEPAKEGQRDSVAFTLALAMKVSGWSQQQAEETILGWVACCEKSSAGRHPFKASDALYKVKHVYGNSKYIAPSAEQIRELSGVYFRYQSFAFNEGKKDRSDRSRSHYEEWKCDVLQLLKQQENQELHLSQQEIAGQIQCPLSSFKVVLQQLQEEGKIEITTKRGRGGYTRLRLVDTQVAVQNASEHLEAINSAPDSIQATNDQMSLKRPENAVQDAARMVRENVIQVDFQKRRRIETFFSQSSGAPVDRPAPEEPFPP